MRANLHESEDELWRYNAEDCVRTREVGEAELLAIEKMGLKQVHEWQQELFWPVLEAMKLGVRVRPEAQKKLAREIKEQLDLREAFLEKMLGHPFNPRSPKQMVQLFYEDLAQPVIRGKAVKGKPGGPTCDDEALQKIARKEPLLSPIVTAISDIRTLGKFLNDFVLAKVDNDGRMRCSYNIGGSESGESAPKTFRLSSSINAFG